MNTSNHISQLSNLNYLKATCDQSVEMINQIADLFLQSSPPSIHKMKQLISESNWNDLKREAHKLKSSFLMMGATLTSTKLQEIESNAEDKERARLSELVNQIEIECTTIYNEIITDLANL